MTLTYNNYLIRVARGGGIQLIFQPNYFSTVPFYTLALAHHISWGHYLPCKIYCLILAVLACIKAVFHIRPWAFAIV